MMSTRTRFMLHVGVVCAVLVVGVSVFAAVRVGLLRSIARQAVLHADASLASASDALRAPSDSERTAEERVAAARDAVHQGTIELALAASASRTYESLANSSFVLLRAVVRSLDSPAAVPASLSSSVFTLSGRIAWRADTLAALRRLEQYDVDADIGSLSVRQDAPELVRRMYLAKNGMSRVSDALSAPSFAGESRAIASARTALGATLDVIDPLIIALNTRRADQAQSLLYRYRVASAKTRNAAAAAYDLLSSDESLAVIAGGHN
jgi:hypothetical protein